MSLYYPNENGWGERLAHANVPNLMMYGDGQSNHQTSVFYLNTIEGTDFFFI